MYFPILRGKQYELLALRECKQKISDSGAITPIIEPVNTSVRDILKCIEKLSDANAPHIVLCNPQVGSYVRDRRSLEDLIGKIHSLGDVTKFAYAIHDETTSNELDYFKSLAGDKRISLIHHSTYSDVQELSSIINSEFFDFHVFIKQSTSRHYRNQFLKEKSVVIQDSFRKVQRNADYANPDTEFLSDQHLTYQEDNLLGFGDYSIIGDYFKPGGGQAHVAAIHLAYEKPPLGEIWVKHFLSEIYDYPNPPAELISEALTETIPFIREHEMTNYSSACQDLIDLYETGRATSLGWVKKVSIKHHIELMIHLLTR